MKSNFKNILVSGGSGLLGSTINFGLKPTRNEVNFLNYSNLHEYIGKNNIQEIVHCAAKVGGVKKNIENMFSLFQENLQINLNILRACEEFKLNNSTFILSTCIFPADAQLPLNENDINSGEPHYTNYGYAYSKRMLHVGSRALFDQFKIKTRCITPCNLFGKNDNYNLEDGHVIPALIHKCFLAKQNNTEFVIWGSGKAEREFIYADDFAKILNLIHVNNITDIPHHMIISPDKTFTIEQIVDIISKKLQYNGKIIFDKSKPDGILKKNTNNSIFKKYFIDFKFTDFEDALSETIEYFIKNYKTIRK